MQRAFISPPRLVVAGLSGDSGKTLVSLGLLLLARQQGMPTGAFKKGPDYIDAAWLGWASSGPARNLDTYLMGPEKATRSFCSHALAEGINVIEGNRGLFDGFDSRGTHSTAELAKLLHSPVLLVVDATKITHTAAALVLGCQRLDPEVQIRGVILNRVSGKRHEAILRESIESTCHVPILGVLPKYAGKALLPGRHLGLVTPEEHPRLSEVRENLLSLFSGQIDFQRILDISVAAPPLVPYVECESLLPLLDPALRDGFRLPVRQQAGEGQSGSKLPHSKTAGRRVAGVGEVVEQKVTSGQGLRVAYLKDSAFTFYYPENLEALEASGASLMPVSALSAGKLPEDLDALYMGGGFPETHGEALSANWSFLASVRERATQGLPMYAECGGLMLLAQAIRWDGKRLPMAGVLPFEVEVCATPQGHGYTELFVDAANGYYPVGITLRGHEFHYSKILPSGAPLPTACAVKRGTGSYAGREGIIFENIWASYTHVHAVATPEWVEGFVRVARQFSNRRATHSQAL